MQCEICNEKDAVVHFKHVADGEMRELNICEDCAVKNGFSIQPPDLLTDFLMGKSKKPEAGAPAAAVRQCLVCGMKETDFSKLSRLGCGACYDAFEKEVEDIVAATQKGNRHIGRFPKGRHSSEDMSYLQSMLDAAITSQNFEEAARIRDIMGSVEGAVSCGRQSSESNEGQA